MALFVLDCGGERLERAGEVRHVLERRCAYDIGELAGLRTVAAEDDDAGVKIVARHRSLAEAGGGLVGRHVVRARNRAFRELLRRPGVEINDGAVDAEDAHDAFELDLHWQAERAPDRNAELIASDIGESRFNQLRAQLASLPTILAVAIDD